MYLLSSIILVTFWETVKVFCKLVQNVSFFNLFSTDFTIKTHINCISIVLHQGHDFHLEKDQNNLKIFISPVFVIQTLATNVRYYFNTYKIIE